MKNTNKPGGKLNDLVKAFKVFKIGRFNNEWATICIPLHEFNDTILVSKMNLYFSLGYKVELI